MIAALPFTFVYVIAASLLIGGWLGGWATLLTPAVVFVGLPLADRLTGHDLGDTSAEDSLNPWFDAVLRLWVPLQIAVVGAVLHLATTRDLGLVAWVGLGISAALVTSGGGITVAHELMHRKRPADRALAEILMTMASYPHFCIEHVLGHHRHVATAADPATSRLGESVYRFLPRVVAGSLASAIRLERERTAKRGIAWYSLKNRLIRYPVMLAGSYAVVAAAFGAAGLAFYVAQGIGAFLLLEVINYVEHYGLSREPSERVRPQHSWNANHRVSNWWLFNLQRHADHHAQASRPYYRLRALEEGPQLPASYPTMILVALVPPLWHRIMDPRAIRSSRPR